MVALLSPWSGASWVSAEDPEDDPLRVLCLGDSITQVTADRSYRYSLWKQFLEAGIPVDFLGTLSDTFELSHPDRPSRVLGRNYDGDHEGHWGWQTNRVAENLEEWLETYPTPDLALVHLGTNDIFSRQDPIEVTLELVSIIGILRRHNPDIILALAEIFPGTWGDVAPFNIQVRTLAGRSTSRSPIVIADCYSEIDLETDSYDGSHPDTSGGNKMAEAWWEAIEPLLQPWVRRYAVQAKKHPGLSPDPTLDSDGDGWADGFAFASGGSLPGQSRSPFLAIHENSVHLVVPFDPVLAPDRIQLEITRPPASPSRETLRELSPRLIDCETCKGLVLPLDPLEIEKPAIFRWIWSTPADSPDSL